ncbi:50S ribosomal protein L9 [Candidatus Kuenenia sp.]|uniref:50S ribosomal protein L9 n=1 Tax=Candidatus Kuenenia sp. TaxID=2499824 RepID=UPI00322006C6
MELLLTKNIDTLGRIGDVVKVKKGYARNYLLPMGMATYVTEGNLKQLEKAKKKIEIQLKEECERLREILETISNAVCRIPAKVNEEGRLFGSVTYVHIADVLKKQGIPIDVDMIKLENPIKECGEYDVAVVLSAEMKTTCKVQVVNEEEDVV